MLLNLMGSQVFKAAVTRLKHIHDVCGSNLGRIIDVLT